MDKAPIQALLTAPNALKAGKVPLSANLSFFEEKKRPDRRIWSNFSPEQRVAEKRFVAHIIEFARTP